MAVWADGGYVYAVERRVLGCHKKNILRYLGPMLAQFSCQYVRRTIGLVWSKLELESKFLILISCKNNGTSPSSTMPRSVN